MNDCIWKLENGTPLWEVEKGQEHRDDIEMSGLYCDGITSYGVKDGKLFLSHDLYFPTLRTIPNNTHGTYCFKVGQDDRPRLLLNGEPISEDAHSFSFDGILHVQSSCLKGLFIKRCIFPASNARGYFERVSIKRAEGFEGSLSLSSPCYRVLSYGRGTKGVYLAEISHTAPEVLCFNDEGVLEFDILYSARIANQPPVILDGNKELAARKERIRSLCDDSLVFSSGEPVLDAFMRLSKLRAGESIFETLSGKFHSPGGRTYYAATWCNDQIEYAGPHFAMTGDPIAIEASLNAYRSYIPFMSDCYHRLPSSIIAEGLDIWEGAGDRGDAAMYLYGASLFCLYSGDEQIARELFPAICWCAEYCERKKTPEGVISSDSDELEGRFPTDGIANLSTSCLCYGGLVEAAKLARSLNEAEKGEIFEKRAEALRIAIEEYFGAELSGFQTYRYSKGFDTLRAWICLPLCVGIEERKAGTLDAMLSSHLWTDEGMLTCQHSQENQSNTIWDRSTLYGMKCAFLSGQGDRMLEPLLRYCKKRLLGERVPYAVEAYPEGGKRHLSGESALAFRIVTEGLFALRPENLRSFSFIPRLPKGLPHLHLRSIPICGGCFDILIDPRGFTVSQNGKLIAQGQNEEKRILIQNV